MKLVARLHNKELQTIRNQAYKSSLNRAEDLQISTASSKLALNLLSLEQADRLNGIHPTPARERMWEMARSSIRFSYEAIKNLRLRTEYLSQVGKIYYCEMRYRSFLKNESAYFAEQQEQQFWSELRSLSFNANSMPNPSGEKLGSVPHRDALSEGMSAWEDLEQGAWGLEPIKFIEEEAPQAESFLETMEKEAVEYLEQLNKLFGEWGSRTSSPWRRAVAPVTKQQFRASLIRETIKETGVPQLFRDALDTREIRPSELQRYSTLDEQMAGAEKAFQSLINSREATLRVIRGAGAALLILTAGIMIWNIAQAEHPGIEIAKAAWTIGPTLVGGYIGAEATVWLLTAFATEAMVFIGGMLGGFIGAFAAGLAAESLFEALVAFFSYHPNRRLTATLCSQPLHSEMILPNHIELSRDFVSRLF